MQKKGYTVVNFILIIGMLLIGFMVLISLKNIFFWQSSETEKDIVKVKFREIKNTIENPMMFPIDSINNISFQTMREYKIELLNHRVTFNYVDRNFQFHDSFYAGQNNFIPNSLESVGNVQVVSQDRNIFITDKLTCTKGDDICDPGCMAQEFYIDRCDLDCYTAVQDDSCISYCIDINKDGITNHLDKDDLCDPDCYNVMRNGGYYDFDCLESGDSICDPDTHMVEDDYCDLDCLGPGLTGTVPNGVCDMDCIRPDIDCPTWEESDALETENTVLFDSVLARQTDPGAVQEFIAAHPDSAGYRVHITGEELNQLTISQIASLWGIDQIMFLQEMVNDFNLKNVYTTDLLITVIMSEYNYKPKQIKDIAERL